MSELIESCFGCQGNGCHECVWTGNEIGRARD